MMTDPPRRKSAPSPDWNSPRVFLQCSDNLATQLQVALTCGKRDQGRQISHWHQRRCLRQMLAPLEVGTRRLCQLAALVTVAYRAGFTRRNCPCGPRLLPSGTVRWWWRKFRGNQATSRRKFRCMFRRAFPASTTAFTTRSRRLWPLRFFLRLKTGRCPRQPLRPSACRIKHTINAVLDEGSTVGGWLDLALDNGFEINPLEPAVVRRWHRWDTPAPPP